MLACMNGHMACIAYMLQCGANANALQNFSTKTIAGLPLFVLLSRETRNVTDGVDDSATLCLLAERSADDVTKMQNVVSLF